MPTPVESFITGDQFRAVFDYDPITRRKCWRAQIRKDGIKVNLGRFLTKEEASLAYAQASLEIFGEFACLD